MSVSITIRNVPDEVRDELAARAARSGRSLQEYLSAQLADLATRPDPELALSAVRARARHYPPIDTAVILDDLHSDRR